jgi:hypothetical protein
MRDPAPALPSPYLRALIAGTDEPEPFAMGAVLRPASVAELVATAVTRRPPARASVSWMSCLVQRRWFLVSVGPEPDRDPRHDDEQALREIHRLFIRSRQTARHGMVTEHDEPAEARAEEAPEARVLPQR